MCDYNTSPEIIEKYNLLKEQFQRQCASEGLIFDEDVYYDSMLKAFLKLAPQGVDDVNDAKNYLWKAFKMNTFREQRYYRNRMKSTMPDDLEIIDECYDFELDNLYNQVIKEIYLKFGEEKLCLFRLHTEKGMKYKELTQKCTYTETQLREIFRNIRNYIKRKINYNL